jgi:hypothetical protein
MSSSLLSATVACIVLVSADSSWANGIDPGDDVVSDMVLAAHASRAVRITIDFAHLLVLDRPAVTVVIGNTGIADANLSDASTIVLTGKTAGTTNLIVLDAEGAEISNILLEVVADGPHLITVHQGIRRQTFSCTRRCEPVLSVGDDPTHFDRTQNQIVGRHNFADVTAGAP